MSPFHTLVTSTRVVCGLSGVASHELLEYAFTSDTSSPFSLDGTDTRLAEEPHVFTASSKRS